MSIRTGVNALFYIIIFVLLSPVHRLTEQPPTRTWPYSVEEEIT